VDRYVVMAPGSRRAHTLYGQYRLCVPATFATYSTSASHVVRGEHTYLRMNSPESKRHGAPIVSMPAAVAVYERLREHHSTVWTGERCRTTCSSHNNWTEQRRWNSWVGSSSSVQMLAGLAGEGEQNRNPRTLYSLRHTAITLRLLYGGHIDSADAGSQRSHQRGNG
jgi:hypothetical protein